MVNFLLLVRKPSPSPPPVKGGGIGLRFKNAVPSLFRESVQGGVGTLPSTFSSLPHFGGGLGGGNFFTFSTYYFLHALRDLRGLIIFVLAVSPWFMFSL